MPKAILLGWYGSDRLIAEEAWVSSKKEGFKCEEQSEDQVAQLVQKLVTWGHRKPLEVVHFHFLLKGIPISVDRQMQTHRAQEASVANSTRYGATPLEFSRTWLGSIEEDDVMILEQHINSVIELYSNLTLKYGSRLGQKRAREIFRDILPQGQLTNRRLVLNLVAFSNMMRLRLKPDAQPEIRLWAQAMVEEVVKANICPVAISTLQRNGWNLEGC